MSEWTPRETGFFSGLKPGETSRKCVVCGNQYIPRSRMQKYCSKECAAESYKARDKVVKR